MGSSCLNHYPFHLKSINGTADHEHRENSVREGIGIVSFFKGKNILILGATGFLGKVLLEKILRMNPDVGKIYVVMKAKDDAAAAQRLKNEILDKEIFKSLNAMHGEDYQNFMLEKIVPVVGDLTKDNIGIKPDIAEEIANEVDIIVNSAANTNFRERKGVILEKAFSLGNTISREMNSSVTAPVLDVETEIKLAFSYATKESTNVQKMIDLGLKRANLYGWQDIYVFTKAMGEMVINSERGEIPVVIIRPSVTESTIKEPVPGWIEGTRMLDPIVLRYGKGQLTGFPLGSNAVVLDIVPADMVVNATLAAIAKHGSCTEPGLYIYQVASSNRNPVTISRIFEMMFTYFKEYAVVDYTGRPIQVQPMRLFREMSEFTDNILTDIIHRNAQVAGSNCEKIPNRLKILCMKWAEQAKYLATVYEPYAFYEGRFDNTNTEKLIDEMSDEERENFYCNVESIDWEHYIEKVHIPGYRKYVMKEWRPQSAL